jgi:hypothetical protein
MGIVTATLFSLLAKRGHNEFNHPHYVDLYPGTDLLSLERQLVIMNNTNTQRSIKTVFGGNPENKYYPVESTSESIKSC